MFVRILGLCLFLIFYGSYTVKMLLQKRQGVSANRMGRGDKPQQTRIIEIALLIGTYTTGILQAVSIALAPVSPYASLGLAIALGACLLFIWAMQDMKTSWRAGVDLNAKSSLITCGVYRFSRNPAFLSFDIFYWGFVLAFPTLPLALVSAVLTLLFHLQILEEEKSLPLIFGKAYLAYRARTRRYF